MKLVSSTSGGPNTPIDDVIGISSEQPNADVHAPSKSKHNTTIADKRNSKKILSDLGHRKRALKEHVSLLQVEKTRARKLVISELAKTSITFALKCLIMQTLGMLFPFKFTFPFSRKHSYVFCTQT
jgi:hypothetical protein